MMLTAALIRRQIAIEELCTHLEGDEQGLYYLKEILECNMVLTKDHLKKIEETQKI